MITRDLNSSFIDPYLSGCGHNPRSKAIEISESKMGGSKQKSQKLNSDPSGNRSSEDKNLSEDELDDNTFVKNGGNSQIEVMSKGFWQRQAIRMARMPRIFLGTSALISIVISVIAFTLGGFDTDVDNAGWQSRGTTIANRQTQLMLSDVNQNYLFYGGQEEWDDVLTNVQPGWQSNSLKGTSAEKKVASENATGELNNTSSRFLNKIGDEFSFKKRTSPMRGHRKLSEDMKRSLLEEADLDGCDISWYEESNLVNYEHLWPIWKSESSSTLLNPSLMFDICQAEENTKRVLEANNLCFGCDEGCLPPYSPVFYARLEINGGFQMDCRELSDSWAEYQKSTETQWALCVKDLKGVFDPNNEWEMPLSCPLGFSAALVEESFDTTKYMTYTSSIFPTMPSDVKALYEIVDDFDRGTDAVIGVYDTQYEGFNEMFTDSVIGRDMGLACASAFITAIAILVHTKSPFLTGIGLMQIILSFPLSFFVYTFVGGLEFFPFLNFIGVFVVFALGADDVFVAVDKWKNVRIEYPNETTEFVASIALPDGAGAMFLTTITTAIAFFGTAICPVAPIKMFAIFCGLLIMFDYLMCILLVFPALCIYDKKLMENRSGCCNACDVFRKKGSGIENEGENDESQSSLIHRILYKYYVQLHRFRWYLFGISVAAFGAAIYGATTLELPTSAEVRLFEEDVVEYEQNYIWRQNLLHETLKKSGGSDTLIGFGLSPDDTGDLSNPKSWSQLILDPTFDAAPEESQIFLESFCPTLFAEAFAMEVSDSYTCPFNLFALWLQEQSNSTTPDEGYVANCANAIGIPVPPSNFDSCLIEWSKQQGETSILSNGGKVRIIFLSFLSRIRWDSPFDVLDAEWNLIEDWVKKTAATAPEGVNKFFFSSMEFWWFDTNSQMLTTAYGAASIALAAAAIVIFLSSRSFVLTLFATLTIFYVLCSVTSTLVALDWTLGFLESICFAILIGVSVDFVIHFCHAYAHIPGEVDRHKRTQIALIRMGPSILAAGVTTIAAAIIMLFTIISFFQKFALILFMTIIQATIGSFIVFLTLTDCFGPSNPTVFVDKGIAVILGKFGVQKPATERLSTSSDLGLTATDEERAGGKIEGK